MEVFVMSLKYDLQSGKKYLPQDMKGIHSDLSELGDRIMALEDKVTPRDEEIELLCLKEQLIDLKAHAEDLENRCRCNNIKIRRAPHGVEDGAMESYVQALFAQVLEAPDYRQI
ncbi:hypothetical protein NDU88_003268 [Pleurodeles waltl]|uniref:Uncharacterized protein n=1 Tax=Pleurodeles waltl TaxID=8319 RepID=A0AAV7KW06_PLEWA|nr:hypothetical protein NDU88_003268 [Pleurodeles waltl]